MITPKQLKEWKKLCKKATPGPWYVRDGLSPEEAGIPGGTWPEILAVDVDDEIYTLGSLDNSNRAQEDTEFIAATREAMPKLIEEVERLKEPVYIIPTGSIIGENITIDARYQFEQKVKHLEQENARLREALERIKELPDNFHLGLVSDEAVKIAREALGGGK